MKLFLKILFFVLSIFQTNISEAKIFALVNPIPETTSSFSFDEEKSNVRFQNVFFEKGIIHTCKSENDLVDYRNLVSGCNANATKTVGNEAEEQVSKNFNKISDNLLKKSGIDAHQLKRDFLGNKAQISRYDLYKDTKTGEILILEKGGKGNPIQTGEFLK
jgi:hypothetical protein